MKPDGLVLLVEGSGRDAEGTIVFRALATISYDLDTDLTVSANGFERGTRQGRCA
jgi:hypothetical protein